MSALYHYQCDVIGRAQQCYRSGASAVLMQMPTGAGKSHAAIGGIIVPSVSQGRVVVFAAHLEEIIDDAASRVAQEGLRVAVVKSGRKLAPNAQVYVCSTPTLARMLERGEPLPPAHRVILDEAHRAASSTNRAILSHYRTTGALILGLTATPSRGDGQPLDEFEQLVTGPSAKELVSWGNLVPCQVFAPDRVLERGVARDPVELVTSECMDRRCVIFAPDGASAQKIHDQLNALGYTCETVLDGTPGETRRGVRGRLASGETRGIVTVRAVIEGFDAPVLDTAILCGAFTTITPWLQAIGRATRAHLMDLRACANALRVMLQHVRSDHDAPHMALDALDDGRREDAAAHLYVAEGPLWATCTALAAELDGTSRRPRSNARDTMKATLLVNGHAEREAQAIVDGVSGDLFYKREALIYDLRGAVYLHGLPEDDRVWSLAGEQGRSSAEREAGLRTCRACHAVFEPRTRCPRCGSVLIADPRPMRVQRAEMFEASGVPVGDRAARYVASVEKKLIERGMPARVAGVRARERAPSWVREALAGAGETQRRAG